MPRAPASTTTTATANPAVTAREVGLLRLVAQGLVGVPAGTGPLDVVRNLTALQAQDLPGALTSVALRTSSRSLDEVVAALDAGTVVRTWPMRGTLHLVAADDVRWLLRTTAARMVARFATRQRELAIDGATLDRAVRVADEALAAVAGRPDAPGLRRAELMTVWEDAGITTTGQRGYHLLVHLAQTGLLCLGPMAGTEQLFVRVVDRVGPGLPVEGDDALAELAGRFFRSHGPATVADLVRWAAVTVRQARTGLALARDGLTAVDLDGVEHWLDPAVPDRLAQHRDEAEQVLLLPGFDEYVLGYADRSLVVPAPHTARVVPGGNGVFRATVVDAGQAVGTWRHVPARAGAARQVTLEPFDGLSPAVEAAARRAHARLP
ncbi:winged helix DNA-binding domain-containing protein [Jannaschia sp. R86511]|uniref:winged helix DNA-binding domain-containing protein n=1 Tax=Jannaschia sp. R86511 TaxID=3093853 RepID=UPI0036D3E190